MKHEHASARITRRTFAGMTALAAAAAATRAR